MKTHRGLSEYMGAALRFIPKISTWHGNKKIEVPALLCVARNDAGDLHHAQVIRLDPTTGNKDQQSNIIKQTYGAINGVGIELNKGIKGQVTYLAEGVETGLCIVEAEKKSIHYYA